MYDDDNNDDNDTLGLMAIAEHIINTIAIQLDECMERAKG